MEIFDVISDAECREAERQLRDYYEKHGSLATARADTAEEERIPLPEPAAAFRQSKENIIFSGEASSFDKNCDVHISQSLRFLLVPLHTHDYFELNFCVGGTAVYETNASSRRLTAGEAILTPPGTAHRTVIDTAEGTVANIGIRRTTFSTAFRALLETREPVAYYFRNVLYSHKNDILAMTCRSLELDRDMARRIAENQRGRPPFYPDENRFLVQALLCQLLSTAQIETRLDPVFEEIRRYAAEHLADVTLKEIAEKFHYSEAHLSRAWKSYFDIGFTDYLTALRLEFSADCLKNTGDSILDIAGRVGYRQESYFIRLFKNRYGITPYQYRRAAGQGSGT